MRLRYRCSAALGLLLHLPGTLVAQEHGGGEAGGSLFSINLGLSVWTVVIFTLLLLVLWRFAWKPILSAVQAREEGIQSALEEARRRQEEAERLLEEHRRQLADARRQAQEIVAGGREAADRLRRELEAKARAESEAMLERAEAEIARERDAALDALRRESVDLALAAASKLLRRKLDAEEDRKMIMEFLDGLSSEGRGVEA